MHWVPSRGRSESAALGVCVYIKTLYTHTPSAADSLRPRDGTQWFNGSFNDAERSDVITYLCTTCPLDYILFH